jgi:hypothetical protein
MAEPFIDTLEDYIMLQSFPQAVPFIVVTPDEHSSKFWTK